MKRYYRPLVASGPGLPLAGGWLTFREVEEITRQGSRIIAANAVPSDLLDRLTRPRADVSGLALQVPRIMGIVNTTPDSFSDGGRLTTADAAIAHAQSMLSEGAEILDIGGESTRPGADFVEIEEEIARTESVIAGLTGRISIDTRKALVAEAALAAGAGILNDVSGLRFDPAMAPLAARTGVPICVMHSTGDPKTMQQNPSYDDVLLDVYDALEAQIAMAEEAGVMRTQIIVDPGIGFGKTQEHNLALLKGLALLHGLGCPILLGASRKRFIGALSGVEAADRRVAGSLAVALAGVAQGAQILRVHDVSETRQALALWQACT